VACHPSRESQDRSACARQMRRELRWTPFASASAKGGAGDGDRTCDIELVKRDNARALLSGHDLLRAPCVVVHVDTHIHRQDRHDEARTGLASHETARFPYDLVSRIFASWNQLASWLKRLDELRMAV
jgi:hypothetical protein